MSREGIDESTEENTSFFLVRKHKSGKNTPRPNDTSTSAGGAFATCFGTTMFDAEQPMSWE